MTLRPEPLESADVRHYLGAALFTRWFTPIVNDVIAAALYDGYSRMSQREVIAAGGATSADDLHLVLSAATGLFVAAYVATTAVGFGWVFRIYSGVTIATAFVFGVLSAQVDKLAAGAPTPYMGLLERIGIGA